MYKSCGELSLLLVQYTTFTRDVSKVNFLVRPMQWQVESAPLGWNKIKVSENLDATAVAPVAPNTSLYTFGLEENYDFDKLKVYETKLYTVESRVLTRVTN